MNTSDRYTCSRFVFCLDENGQKIEKNRMDELENWLQNYVLRAQSALQYTCIPPPKGWLKIPGYSVCYFNALAFYNHLIICGVDPHRRRPPNHPPAPPQPCGVFE